MQANIRRADESDAGPLAILAERTFRATFTANNQAVDMDLHCEQSFGPEIQLRELQDSGVVTLVAEVEGKLVAFAQLRLTSSTESVNASRPCELYRIYLSSEWHGRGLAQQLMDEVLRAAVAAKCDCIWLGVWELNPRAIAFYQKFGFSVVGEHTFKLGEDPQIDLVMAAELAG